MRTKDRAKLRNIADRLQVILDELREFEKAKDDPAVKQCEVSTAMALAWIDLVASLRLATLQVRRSPDLRKHSPDGTLVVGN